MLKKVFVCVLMCLFLAPEFAMADRRPRWNSRRHSVSRSHQRAAQRRREANRHRAQQRRENDRRAAKRRRENDRRISRRRRQSVRLAAKRRRDRDRSWAFRQAIRNQGRHDRNNYRVYSGCRDRRVDYRQGYLDFGFSYLRRPRPVVVEQLVPVYVERPVLVVEHVVVDMQPPPVVGPSICVGSVEPERALAATTQPSAEEAMPIAEASEVERSAGGVLSARAPRREARPAPEPRAEPRPMVRRRQVMWSRVVHKGRAHIFRETSRRYHKKGGDAGLLDWIKGRTPDGFKVKIEFEDNGEIDDVDIDD
ncbi:MAG: hypothetical protein U9M92_01420 [Patescibacteria group bacterium]|nr:hypothetical protein [Patescibacteria group bacterium]